MNILFLTLANMEDINQRSIYKDLVRELSNHDVNIYVVSPRQKRTQLPTDTIKIRNINIIRVKTGNLTSTNSLIEKGLSTIMIEYQYLNAIKKYFKDIKFDMVMYSTPPITFNKIIKYYKKNHNSLSYLILKDIFPQNAIDIGLMKENSIIHKIFRKKETELYNQSDIIGCMSQGNMDYVLKHNNYINPNKVEVFPNAIKPIKRINKRKKNRSILKKYNISEQDTLFIYGGNLGKPQGINFLLKVVDQFEQIKNGHLLIIGSGTEYSKIESHIELKEPVNVGLYNKLPKEEYDQLVNSADVGLIFLDKRFTIPNFPSRLTSYMENSLPILAATDKNTDLRDVLYESKSGFWSESEEQNVGKFIKYAQKLAKNPDLRSNMGNNGRKYLEENYDINKTVNILLNHINGDDKVVQR